MPSPFYNKLFNNIKDIYQKGEERGIFIKPNEDSPYTFKNEDINSKLHQEVTSNFDNLSEKYLHSSDMSRRDFLKTPTGITLALASLSSGLGMSLWPETAHAQNGSVTPFADAVLGPLLDSTGTGTPFVTFGNPTVPYANADFSNPVNFEKVDEDFSSKTAVITGGTSGIGLATAIELKEVLGFGNVVVTSRFGRKEYPDFPGNIDLQRCDNTKPSQIRRFGRYLKRKYGRVDLLHLNAARIVIGRSAESNLKEVELGRETNYIGNIRCYKEIEPLMPTSGYARLLVTTSTAFNLSVTPEVPGEDIAQTEIITYLETKRSLTLWALFLDAAIKNSSNPNTAFPPTRTNMKVSIILPVSVGTQLGFKRILAEDDPAFETAADGYGESLNELGLPKERLGLAFGQIAQLKNPKLFNYNFDADFIAQNPTDPRGSFQAVIYAIASWEEEISMRTSRAELLFLGFPPGTEIPIP